MILNARINVQVVVDLDDVEVPAGLFDIDSVQAVANQIGSLHREIDCLAWGEFNRHRVEVSEAVVTLFFLLNHLPMAGGHVVLAGEEWTPVEACDLIASLVCEQFWDWFLNPTSKRRFKPRIKLSEVY